LVEGPFFLLAPQQEGRRFDKLSTNGYADEASLTRDALAVRDGSKAGVADMHHRRTVGRFRRTPTLLHFQFMGPMTIDEAY
ncbi:MAG: hypothetical protein KKC18_07375, partial [Chloroflexi bacterium]|nr:hypothetical protein [Chloroflexota bacterium]